ncbi:MAG TPA: biotin-dependent carboxyltransferase family protein [Candidatus Limnocylindrales bacterium]|nr:biotin-dependent carboxyltransferase family protein [Candidatus Limnocylindrales bacterium]
MLEVIEAGLLSTVQAGSRREALAYGVPPGGACDGWSLALANALLGNAAQAPGVEMTLTGLTVRALADCWLALAGADMEPSIDGRQVPAGRPVRLAQGERLVCGAARPGSGIRSYLALPGGLDVPEVLGSPSTCLVGGFGGLDGRSLRAGDRLRPAAGGPSVIGRWEDARSDLGAPLRVVPGPHADELPGAFEALLAGDFVVSARGDRQAIRLEGGQLPAGSGTIVSQPMMWGAVQLPPDGRPIVLLADHQTVGGYPVPAVVISADLPRLGQLGPGDTLRFIPIGLAQARAELAAHRRALGRLPELVAVGA